MFAFRLGLMPAFDESTVWFDFVKSEVRRRGRILRRIGTGPRHAPAAALHGSCRRWSSYVKALMR
jgi:hypothetical protein